MAKVKLNPLLKSIRGKMGDVVFRTSKTGEITVAKTALLKMCNIPLDNRKSNCFYMDGFIVVQCFSKRYVPHTFILAVRV